MRGCRRAGWRCGTLTRRNGQQAGGLPGAGGWPGNDNHYRVALLQADGGYDMEQSKNRGDVGDLYRGGGVSVIGADTQPDTHAYQGGVVQPTGNRITVTSGPGRA